MTKHGMEESMNPVCLVLQAAELGEYKANLPW